MAAAVIAGGLVALYFIDVPEESASVSEISETTQPADTPEPSATPAAEEPKAEQPAAAESLGDYLEQRAKDSNSNAKEKKT